MKRNLISLTPLDVGFDLRCTSHAVRLPDFQDLTVRYMDGDREVTSQAWTGPMARRLRAAGYTVAQPMAAPVLVRDCPEYPGEHQDWIGCV